MSRYVVTGGAGFIGSNIVRRLVEEGHEVRVIDDFSTGRRCNLSALTEQITLFEGDICDPELLPEVFDGAEVVFHQAAIPSVQRSVEDPLSSNEANVEGTLKVLEAARAAQVRRVVYASSSSVYGDSEQLPKHEAMPVDPKSPYAVGKLAGEHYCRVYNEVYPLQTVCLRYFNVFGPRQDPDSDYSAVIPIFSRCALTGTTAAVFGDGEQSRDFTYVDNVVEANLAAAAAPNAAGGVMNVGLGRRHTLNELLDALSSITGRHIERDYCPERPGDVRHSQADTGRLRSLPGYRPRVDFQEGLRRTVEWYQKSLADL